jgi:hypothetical protein
MTSVRTRILAALLALVPAGGLLVAAAPAQAATTVKLKSVSVSKSAFVLSGSTGCSAKVTFTAVLSAALPTEGYKFSGVGVDFFAPGHADEPFDGVAFTQVGTTTTYKGSLKICGKYAGNYRAEVYGALLPASGDLDMTNVIAKVISVKRPSKLTLNATPEPVKKGKKVTAKGTLKIDGKVLSGAKVKVWFKAKGASAYTYKGVATTNSKGAYSKAFTATKTGTWKVSYAGSNTRNNAAATDAVAVK